MSERFQIEERVRWGDVDAAGVVYFSAFARFFQIAETELFREAGVPYGRVFDRFDIWLPRVRYACDFHAPAHLDERLYVSAWIGRLGTRSITLAFAITTVEGGLPIADCEIVLVSVDRKTWKTQPIPAELRSALAPFAGA